MREQRFLAKIWREKKLQLVEISLSIKQSYVEKSESNLISAKILIEHDRLEEAVSLTYYSMYHIVTALLFSVGVKCENHMASIILLKEVFDIENEDIKFAKKERVDKQYYTDFSITKKEVESSINVAEEFNGKLLDVISRLTSQDVEVYHNKLVALVKAV